MQNTLNTHLQLYAPPAEANALDWDAVELNHAQPLEQFDNSDFEQFNHQLEQFHNPPYFPDYHYYNAPDRCVPSRHSEAPRVNSFLLYKLRVVVPKHQ